MFYSILEFLKSSRKDKRFLKIAAQAFETGDFLTFP